MLPPEPIPTDLDQRMLVRCPANAASTYLSEFVRAGQSMRNGGEPGNAQLALRPPVMLPVMGAEIVLQRDVVVEIAPAGSAADRNTFGVTWAPAGGGPFPRFKGTLSIEPDDEQGCCLILQGHAAPVVAGSRNSELALGHQITISAARTLLRELRTGLEQFSRSKERTL